MLAGSYPRTLDRENRVTMPRSFRDALGCRPGGTLLVVPANDHSLGLFLPGVFADAAQRVAQSALTAYHVGVFSRLLAAQAQRVVVDRRGRIRIPPDLYDLAQLGRRVVLLGVRDHVELWPVQRWNAYLASSRSDRDQIARTALGGPGL